MLVNGLKSYSYLTRAQLGELKEHAKGVRKRVADLVVHKYDWLISDFKEHKWKILDHRGKEFKIDFDSPLPNGGVISDNPLLIEDLKLYFVAAKIKNLRNSISLNSSSTCKAFVRHLKRYVIESMALEAVTNPNMLTKIEFDFVVDSMAKKLPNSLGYKKLLQDYLDRTPVESIPIKRYEDKKSPSHVDTVSICQELNMPYKYVLASDMCKQIIARASVRVSAFYSDEFFEVKYKHTLDQETFRTMMHSDEYSKSLLVLEGVHSLYPAYRELFNYELVKYPLNHKELIAKPDFSEQEQLEERTRDIPPLLFLKLMDAACRFILDYADDLFQVEEKFSEIFEGQLKEGKSSYDVGKAVNKAIKGYKLDDKRQFTPFPLAAYKHAQERAESKYADILEDILKDDKSGVLSKKQVCEKYDISYPSLMYIRKMVHAPTNTTGLSLHKALYQFLPFSCTVVIMALTARREMEVFGLQVGCIRKDDEGNFWLDSYVAKTLQDDYTFTTVAIVDKAVTILEKLSKRGREITGSNSLFVFDDTFERKPTSMKSITHIAEDFFDFIGIERDHNGEHWKLSEHQFRRFFAIMYFYRYSSTNTEALMHELGHRDWSMTLRYLSKRRTAEAMAELDKQLQDIMAERIADLAERDDLDGEMFKSIKALMRSSIHNISGVEGKPQEIMRCKLIEKIKENSLVIDFIPSGLCFGNTPKLKANCKCLKNGHVMLHEASDDVCKGCPAQLTVPEIAAGNLHNLSTVDEGNSIILDAIKTKEVA
ncbi:TPA: tyrosine-type recombinase/integrase [Vibrio parahaemolyticus]|nr:tyrosine-type recombinase/integrase [Vibrio parahaemolyticus]